MKKQTKHTIQCKFCDYTFQTMEELIAHYETEIRCYYAVNKQLKQLIYEMVN